MELEVICALGRFLGHGLLSLISFLSYMELETLCSLGQPPHQVMIPLEEYDARIEAISALLSLSTFPYPSNNLSMLETKAVRAPVALDDINDIDASFFQRLCNLISNTLSVRNAEDQNVFVV